MKKYCFALGMILTAIPLFAQTQLMIDGPRDQMVLTTSSTGALDDPANVELLIKVLNAEADSDRLTFTPSLDSAFPLGDTRVTCTATDRSGNYGVVTFTVTVQPASAPPSRDDLVDYLTWINQVAGAAGPMPLTASTVPGKLYQIQFALTSGDLWRDWGTPFIGTGQRLAYNDDISSLLINAPQTFLRVKVYDADKYLDGVAAPDESVTGIYDLMAELDPIATGWGNDWLVGGTGRDAPTRTLQRIGGGGDDILIGGQTGYEETDIQTGGGRGRDVLIGGAGSDL